MSKLRTEFSDKTKLQRWNHCGGRCEQPGCGAKLFPGKAQADHDIACELGGDKIGVYGDFIQAQKAVMNEAREWLGLPADPSPQAREGSLGGEESLLDRIANMVEQSMWSPASGSVVWNDEKIARMKSQARYLAESILRIASPPSAGWQPPDLNPTIKRGAEKYFIVAVRRAHSGRVYEFPALYLNEYPLQFEDDYEERLCTGWYQATPDGDSHTYSELVLSNEDALVGWQPLPKFIDHSPPSGRTEPANAVQPTDHEPIPDLQFMDKADDEAVAWVTKNLSAIRRDNGNMDYSLKGVVRAYQAGAAFDRARQALEKDNG